MKKLTSIMSCCIDSSSNNALSPCGNQFWHILLLLINLLYNNVKNLTSILSCSEGIKSISSRKVQKALSVQDSRLLHIFYIFTWQSSANKQPINLLYKDVKNLISILNCYIGPKCVSSINDKKALSLCHNHYSFNFRNRQWKSTAVKQAAY